MALTVHDLAFLGSLGSLLAILGSLYWAYELLGGQKGPMNLLPPTVTYSLMFGIGYGILLGWAFGILGGIGLGTILSVEGLRVARHQRLYGSSPLHNTPWFGVARGLVIGLASWPRFGGSFAALFSLFCSVVLYVVYWHRYAPTYD